MCGINWDVKQKIYEIKRGSRLIGTIELYIAPRFWKNIINFSFYKSVMSQCS